MKISEKTMIPLYFLPFIAGAIFWLAKLENQVGNMCHEIEKVNTSLETVSHDNIESQKNLAEINVMLGYIKSKMDRRHEHRRHE